MYHHVNKAVVSVLLVQGVLCSSIPKQTDLPEVENQNFESNHGFVVQRHELPTTSQQLNQVLPTQEVPAEPTTPAYTPIVTPGPDQDKILSSMGYYQTTFYTCNTYPSGQEHCGWHVPVLKAEGARTETGVVVMVVACFAGFFAMGMM